MKKDIFNELTGLDEKTVNEIAENAPELDRASQERILKKCMEKDGSSDEVVVSGTERYRRPKYRSFAAAAAAVVLVGGIGGAFALGRSITKNAPSESVKALVTTDDGIKEVDPAVVPEGGEAQGDTEGKPLAPDCTEPANVQEYTVPEVTDGEEYAKWLDTIPEEYRDTVRNLKPGEVIHLPCLTDESTSEPVRCPIEPTRTSSTDPTEPYSHYLDDPDNWGKANNGEPISPPPQNTTAPAETTTEPLDNHPPLDTTEPPISPPVSNELTFTGKYWTGSLEGYWTSDWCGQSYFHFDTNTHTGSYYNSNTCTGYSFEFSYYINNDSHIEVMVLDREIGYSGELYGTGMVYWTDSDHFYIEWKAEAPIRQGQQIEHFSRNYTEAMPE